MLDDVAVQSSKISEVVQSLTSYTQVSDPSELDGMMDQAAYDKFLAESS